MSSRVRSAGPPAPQGRVARARRTLGMAGTGDRRTAVVGRPRWRRPGGNVKAAPGGDPDGGLAPT